MAPARDAAALTTAVEAYYLAETPDGMRAAVAAARQAGVDTGLHHQVAADLAQMEDRRRDEMEHRLAALRDPEADNALSTLHRIASMRWTDPERALVEGHLAGLVAGHHDPEVAAFAAWMLAHARHLRGDDEGRDELLAGIGVRLDFAVIGTWDNDQGKGFDAEQPPEREMNLSKTYPTKRLEAKWRTDYVRDPRGKLDLGAILEPSRWQVAYAAAAVRVREAGAYELRISSSDPLKVWVNDSLVFQGRRIDAWLFDALPIPVRLRAGVNRVLVKSAQGTGSWLLVGRVTRGGGAPVGAGEVVQVAADGAYSLEGSPPVDTPWLEESLLERRVSGLPKGTVRHDWQRIHFAKEQGLAVLAAALAERFVEAHPKSLRGRYLLAGALWNNQERGRTADLLNALVGDVGDAFPFLGRKQARFWLQQKLEAKARKLLVQLTERHPDRPGAWVELAAIVGTEGWHEDRCRLLKEVDRRWPQWPPIRKNLAQCYEELRFYPRAVEIYRPLLAALPNDSTLLRRLHWQAQGNDQFGLALTYARALTKGWPHHRGSWQRLGETLRRQGDRAGAEAAWQRLIDLAPNSADGYQRLARLAMQAGETARAVRLWKEALQRDPENDRLANRLAWIAPSEEGPWAADVPDEAAIDAVLHARASVEVANGANVVYLLDDEVTALAADGSTANFVTIVAHAVNQAGRDRLTRMSVRSGGRARILHAYAVDPAGNRLEASSIRGRTVRFRKLGVGSTVVLQYRIDQRPDGYLAGHMARQWWFQGPATQAVTARWVLWLPRKSPLVEYVQGDVERDARIDGELKRVMWRKQNAAPVVPEPAMPTIQEIASHVLVSTVPDWNMFWKWEQALLHDAFRESPELIDLAKELTADTDDPEEKVRRIHAYLMTRIRYQQDYERRIAGVKPHPAPVVVSRQYGDCKDKAVLFMTLARLVGVEVHFALVRTRDAGPVRREVPMQQFNHAIVYVPKQPGIAEGRFYDPTVDALDVDVLRHDDQGTWSLVYDPHGRTHDWRAIPFQSSALDYANANAVLELTNEGSAEGVLELVAQGRTGETLRRTARNPEQMQQLLQRRVSQTFPGARIVGHELLQVEDVRRPAKVRMHVQTPGLGRREGRDLRLRLPIGWSPQHLFSLPVRRHMLMLGTPRTWTWRTEVVLPAGSKVKRAPSSDAVESECLALRRTVRVEAGRVVGEHQVEVRCERISADAYGAHRADAERMLNLLREELVVSVKESRKRRTAAR